VTAADPGDGARLRRLAATASLALAVLLAALKLAAALATGSLAVLSSLVDSLADVAASAVTFVSVRVSQQPPDRGHRFGHGKAESLSALAQAALVAGSAVFVLVDALRRFWEPQPVRAAGLGAAVMVFATLATLALVVFQRHVVRRTGSPAIAADSLHYRADLATNLAVVASLLAGQRLGWAWLDPLVGLAIAAYLVAHAAAIGRDAVKVLMDHELPGAARRRIEAIVAAHPEVRGSHDLRTRESGTTVFIELHVELDPDMTVAAAHDVTDALEAALAGAFPDSEIIIHQEPAGLADARLDHRIAAAVGAGSGRLDRPEPRGA
jgi:ferrous-iron efflux pump FieF